ncbi:hypothetical protein FRB99_003473 [Tulasnella sp. 403]|nr:hypothetical protein FRB99_003473 [Tulasnella sp. 403]
MSRAAKCSDPMGFFPPTVLSLTYIKTNLPTIGRLVSLLSASPQLCQLNLSDWTLDNPLQYGDDAKHHADTIIELPSLSVLIIRHVPQVFADSGSTLFEMVAQVLRPPHIQNTAIYYHGSKDVLSINSICASESRWTDWREDQPTLRLSISAEACPTFDSTWQTVTDILAAHAPCVNLEFNAVLPDARQSPDQVPLALLPHLPHIERVVFGLKDKVGAVLRHLATKRSVASGGMQWLCPRLDSIVIHRDSDRADDTVRGVVEFLRQRCLPREIGEEHPLITSYNTANDEKGQHESDVSSSQTGEYPTTLKQLFVPTSIHCQLQKTPEVRDLSRQRKVLFCGDS